MPDAVQAERDADVQVRLTGCPHARVRGSWQRLPLDLGTTILFYLGVRRVWCARSRITALFWPDTPAADAHRRLRQHLQRLKALAWATRVEVEPDRIRWSPATDLDGFERAASTNDLSGALRHYRGPLLDGLSGDRAGDFGEWLRAERWAWHDRWRQVAFRAVDEGLGQGVRATDAHLMVRVRDHDPFDEAALRREMLVLEALGEREAAIRSYARYETWLAQEAEASPEEPTQDLAARLRRVRTSMDGAAGQPARPLPAGSARHGGRARVRRSDRQRELLVQRPHVVVRSCDRGVAPPVTLA